MSTDALSRWPRPRDDRTVEDRAGVNLFRAVVAAGILLAVLIPFSRSWALALALAPAAVLAVSRPYWATLFLIAFIPFEDFILKFLPVPDAAYSLSRFVSEILIYLTFAAVVLTRLLRGERLRRTPIDLPILLFLAVASTSMLVNGAPVIGSLINVRALLRYVVLFYLVVNLTLGDRQVERAVRVVLVLAAVQVVLAAAQMISGDALASIFLPRESTIAVGEYAKNYVLLQSGRELGSIYGTLGDTVLFGLFLLVVFVLYLSRYRRPTVALFVGASVLLLAIAFSYSRAAVLGALLVGFVWYRFRRGWPSAIRMGIIGLIAFAAFVVVAPKPEGEHVAAKRTQQSIVENLSAIFTTQYVDVAKKQRLAAILGNVPTVLVNRPLLGFGPDELTAIERLNASQSSYLLKIWDQRGFKDVYWAALLTFYGILGVTAFLIVLFRLYRSAREIYDEGLSVPSRRLALAVLCLVVVTTFMLFVNRALEFRPYGFYFWLLAGLMFSSHRAARKRHDAALPAHPRGSAEPREHRGRGSAPWRQGATPREEHR